MINEFHESEDMNEFGTMLYKRPQLFTDFDSLTTGFNFDSRPININSSPKEFLEFKRRESESNFIKTAILTKLHYNIPLTKKQKAYHEKWKECLKKGY